MAKNSAAFTARDRVLHSVYGLGTISEAGERHTTIVFDENGTRKFITSMVRLEHTSTPAPVKPARAKKAKA
jgi:hypothetical protein